MTSLIKLIEKCLSWIKFCYSFVIPKAIPVPEKQQSFNLLNNKDLFVL